MQIEQFNPKILTNHELILFNESICKNPYLLHKPYPKQSWPLLQANRPLENNEPNMLLVGAGGFGGKTYLGTMLAAQYLDVEDYSCLVTRLNYAELTGEDSIWQNLNEWVCDEDRLGDLACESNESKLRITAPSGAKIWFKAFDHPKKKGKVKSESYDRIINDEASELNPNVLTFFFRSLRSSLDSRIPLGMINLSNPGGPSTDYLLETFVEGPHPYFPLDWRDNPYINKATYSKTLDKLTYADQRYQKYGDWHYTPKSGDVFSQEDIDKATLTIEEYKELTQSTTLLSLVRLWDIAATDKDTADYTAHSLIERYKGFDVVRKQSTFRLNPGPLEGRMSSIMEEDGSEVEQLIEKQPAAAGKIVDRYWKELFVDYNVKFIPVFKNKVVRAGKLVHRLKDNRLYFVEDSQNPYLDILKKQAVNFPNFDKLTYDDPESLHDDRIDSLSLLTYERTVLRPRRRRK
ncbi:MAG: Terminase-like family protein [Methanobacterium sp. PtaB.Bin024]|nr:MAG: Terminase-like family protein [Methanobacterium sp. PtaB.Bin024]